LAKVRNVPGVTIVVLNWRDYVATARCLASVRRLDGIEDCELIVVDNESEGAGLRALAALEGVRVIPLETNRGFTGGMNIGIAAACGQNVALLNNDLVVDRAWLAEGLRVLQDPAVGMVGGAALYWDGAGQTDCASAAVATTTVDAEAGFAVLGAAPETEGPVAAIDGSNILARTDLLRELKGFDDRYFAYGEDIDLCARAWALGYASVFSPAMKVWHRRGGSSDRIPRQRAFWAARNHIVTVAKHFPEDTWRRTAFHLALNCVSDAVLGRRGGISAKDGERLNRDQRLGMTQAAWWCATHPRELAARRVETIDACQHDERYTERLRALARN
jgi:GT2 family glycosyltransferase